MADQEATKSSYRQGWVCPKCGSVYAPTWYTCTRCKPKGSLTYGDWTPPPSAVPERFRSTSAPRFNGG